jgi:hypothetical protein
MLLDITSEKEISDFLAATWNEETNWFIDGWEQIRAELLAESEQAYEFDGSSLKPTPREGFYATLIEADAELPMGREYDWLFYTVTSSTANTYIFPSEWDLHNEPAPLYDAEYPALYVSTFLGIWRITANGVSTKLSADEFDGNHYSWHVAAAYSPQEGWSKLFWIANAILSPDKRYIVYRSNRDCYDDLSDNTSIWRIDLETGEEQRILEGNAVNTINGFVTDKLILVDQRFLLDVSNGKTIPITLPELPNRSIDGTGFGYIVCTSYSEDVPGVSTLLIFSIDPETGALTEMFSEQGLFYKFGFSPSGKNAYVVYGRTPNRGAETLMLFDFEKTTARLLEDVPGDAYKELDGDVIRAIWLSENAMLLNVCSVVDNKGVYLTWIAQW